MVSQMFPEEVIVELKWLGVTLESIQFWDALRSFAWKAGQDSCAQDTGEQR